MKLFLDTAIVSDIEERLPSGLIEGITTNPTLIKKSGRDPWSVYRDIVELGVDDLSVEVVGETSANLITLAKLNRAEPWTVEGQANIH